MLKHRKKDKDWQYDNTTTKLRGLAAALQGETTGPRRKWGYGLPEPEDVHKWVRDEIARRRELEKEREKKASAKMNGDSWT
jgi:hypothetical protein